MTGFGRGSAATECWHATVEISAVNRKQLEIVVQTARELQQLEAAIRKAVHGRVSRGRVQVSVTLEATGPATDSIKVDKALAVAFHNAFDEIGKWVGHPLRPTPSDYLRQPGIIHLGSREIDSGQAWLAIEPALTEALVAHNAMRETEGAHL